MTGSLETLYFVYITNNRHLFDLVEPTYFRNEALILLYRVIKDYLKSPDIEYPKNKQLWEMVKLADKNSKISRDMFKTILSTKLDGEYDIENFIKPSFEAWVLYNRIDSGTTEIIDITREMSHATDFEEIQRKAADIREISEYMTSTNFIDDDDDLGSDFDDVEAHNQDIHNLKVKTGIECLDEVLSGGLDIGLTVIAGTTNSGKSLWLQNIAYKAADLGTNVLYITLEMSEKKTMKRLGAMRLRIPTEEYDVKSMDPEYMRMKLNSHLDAFGQNSPDDIFGEKKKIGKIKVKYWNSGTITVQHINDLIQKYKKKGLEFGMIVVDYLTLVALPKNLANENIFMKGKYISEGLRGLGHTYHCPVVTAVQISKDDWGSTNVSLKSISESKGISETADIVLGIIRTEEMKRENKYRIKCLKQRDGKAIDQFMIDLNPTYLNFENDKFVSPDSYM